MFQYFNMNNLRQFIKQVLLAFEQNSTTIKYSDVYKYNDGPDDIEQITLSFGITEYGNLKKFIKTYSEKNGKYAEAFSEYLPIIGSKPLNKNTTFINLLKESAKEDPIMRECQEEAYDSMYITPAYAWCDKNNIILPLSKLVIADSFLQSGSILSTIRNMFSEKIPTTGGDEKKWVEAYCRNRRSWLANHSRKVLHNTVYRMDLMLSLIKQADWNLTQPFYVANDVKVVAS